MKTHKVKTHKKKRRSPWRALLLLLLAVLLLTAAGAAVFIKSKLNKIHYSDGTLPAESLSAEDAGEAPEPEELWQDEEPLDAGGLETVESVEIPQGTVDPREDVINVLLLGTDFPMNSRDPGRADSIMILSLDFRDNSARLVSLERAMGMPILFGKFEGQWDWLTHLHHYGGAELMLEAVRTCFHLDVERFAEVNFDGFRGVVNALGGIDIELNDTEAWRLGLRTGWNHMDGAAALSFARLRSIDSDWVRVTRQRRVIQACADRLKGADLLTLNRLADTVLPMITTNFTQGEILSLMTKMPKFLGVEFEQLTIPVQDSYGIMIGMGGRGLFAPDFELNTRILHEFLYGESE